MSFSYAIFGLLFLTLAMAVGPAAGDDAAGNDARAQRFVQRHEAKIRPLEIESARSWWLANTTGSDEAYRRKQEAETRLDLLLSDRPTFAELASIKSRPIGDPLLARQIAVLYLQYLGRQIDPELLEQISARSNAVEKAFSVFRAGSAARS